MIKEEKTVKDIKTLYRRWTDARKAWDNDARDDIDFYLGNHFTPEELDALQSRNQSSMPVDRLYSAIEQFKAIVTSKPPKFSAIAREDSDNKVAQVWRTILEYIWDISDGDEVFKQAIHDYSVTGLGYFYAYLDKESDYGRGEVRFTHLNPFRVAVDPNSRHRYFDDATGIMVSTLFTKMQLQDLYPELMEVPQGKSKPLIDLIEGDFDDEDFPSPSNTRVKGSYTPDVIKDADHGEGSEKYRLIEYYSKIKVNYYRLVNLKDGTTKILSPEQFEAIVNHPVDGPVFQRSIEKGELQYVEIPQTRIKLTCILGQIILYERILETDIFPIIPVPNIWTNTPYPMSDVRKNKDFQRFLNKVVSLITSHAQASSGLKLLIPQGSVHDIEELERDWANPNATIEYDPSFGEPHFPSPQPLASSIMQLPQLIERYIDLNMGIFEMMQGNAEAAPRTYSATMMMEDLGQRRSKSKLRDIEGSIKRLGRVVYNLSKSHYDYEKTFRVVQPNNDIDEFTVNKRLLDDKSKEIETIENDLTVGQFDIKVIGNSTMPSNKWGEWEVYMQAYQAGLIDRVEALKKTEIFDKQGVLQRTDEMAKLQGMVQQAEEQIKKLSGDLQTSQRETIQSNQKVEVEKFKGRLKEVELGQKADSKIQAGRLGDAVKLEQQRLRKKAQEDERAKNKRG